MGGVFTWRCVQLLAMWLSHHLFRALLALESTEPVKKLGGQSFFEMSNSVPRENLVTMDICEQNKFDDSSVSISS